MLEQLLYKESCYLSLVGGICISWKKMARLAPKPVCDNTGSMRYLPAILNCIEVLEINLLRCIFCSGKVALFYIFPWFVK